MVEVRDAAAVRREIAAEREQLAEAVERLHSETTRTKRRIASRVRIVPAALAAGLVAIVAARRIARYALRRLRG